MSSITTAPGAASSASWLSAGAGITGGYNGNSETLRMFIVFFAGLAMYNACELIAMVALTFARHRGLYFWSLLVSSVAVIPYSVGFLLKFMNITTGNVRWLAVVLLTIGWYPMVTGQSVVLWSRLHLIVSGERGDKIIFWTKWMIVVNAIILHIPTTVLTFGSNGDVHISTFERGYNVMEKIQMIGFFIQEVILSSIYIFETVKILRGSLQPHTRKTMIQLIVINVAIIVMDLGLLGLECASLYILETLLKGVIYSIKLKLEFAILGKLVRHVTTNRPAGDMRTASIGFMPTANKGSIDANNLDVADFVDMTRVATDVSHPSHGSSSSTARRKSRRADSQMSYNMQRFAHVEDISTLQDSSRATSRSRIEDMGV